MEDDEVQGCMNKGGLTKERASEADDASEGEGGFCLWGESEGECKKGEGGGLGSRERAGRGRIGEGNERWTLGVRGAVGGGRRVL
eukprot:3906540-Pleurochrysis_carterae.AAC.2